MTEQTNQRTCLISGSSSGIGAAISEKLLSSKHLVLGLSRKNTSPLSHSNLQSIQCDVSDLTNLENCIGKLLKEHSIDSLVCNAGIGRFGSLEEFSIQQIEQSIQTNLLSHMVLCRLLLPTLKQQPRSNIVFIGSESAVIGARYGSVYSAAKFGLRGFAQSLRHECSNSNCHIGIVNPGMVRTGFFDELDFEPGEAKENALLATDVADAVMHLLESPDHAVVEEININPLKRVVRKSK